MKFISENEHFHKQKQKQKLIGNKRIHNMKALHL
jgi:hypothetical protein